MELKDLKELIQQRDDIYIQIAEGELVNVQSVEIKSAFPLKEPDEYNVMKGQKILVLSGEKINLINKKLKFMKEGDLQIGETPYTPKPINVTSGGIARYIWHEPSVDMGQLDMGQFVIEGIVWVKPMDLMPEHRVPILIYCKDIITTGGGRCIITEGFYDEIACYWMAYTGRVLAEGTPRDKYKILRWAVKPDMAKYDE